jgi:23S rRNA pseudouridine1911/1915/1917 synthase
VVRTLLDRLQELFPDSSKTTLRQMLQNNRVRVNGRTERDAKRLLETLDRIDVGAKHEVREPDAPIQVLRQDEHLIVVNKAAGILTVPGRSSSEESVEEFLNRHLHARPGESRVHVVHRLDRDTSGVLVFARNTHVRDRLGELFEGHDIERVYVAIVHGKVSPPAGTFRSFLAEDRELRVRSVREEEGKEAITHYRTIASNERFTMLEVTLETGRRNQIRVHFSDNGHPVIGDTMYGKGLGDPIRRLGLHAKMLGFVHPMTGAMVRVTAPPPEEFEGLFRTRERGS